VDTKPTTQFNPNALKFFSIIVNHWII